ncbi:MAG: type II toxin-antitoxin system RelE/ParE family toxin [Bacteroidaceae bacterium]|nr:type II toxin-antitoxin system RelE/ParE family toxin [Bacteroidaceae bacterium]
MEKIRDIIFYKTYFKEFYIQLDENARTKINYVLKLIQTQERIPIKFFKFIEGSKGLYEIRVKVETNIYRVFCCYDKGSIVVLFNGFVKKTQKTPKSEIEKAEAIMKEYFENKKEG